MPRLVLLHVESLTGLHRRGEANGFGRCDVEQGRACFGDDHVTVEEHGRVATPLDGERTVERRRHPQANLRGPSAERRRCHTAGVSPVARAGGPVEVRRDRDLRHRSVGSRTNSGITLVVPAW